MSLLTKSCGHISNKLDCVPVASQYNSMLSLIQTFNSSFAIEIYPLRGLVNGINITELPQNSADSNEYQDNWIDALNETVQSHCPYVTALRTAYAGMWFKDSRLNQMLKS